MKKSFITKATSMLLVSQFLLSTAPLTALAVENATPTTGESSSNSSDFGDELSRLEGNKVDPPLDSNEVEEIIDESYVENNETDASSEDNKLEETIENPSSEKTIDSSEEQDQESKLKSARVAVVVTNDVEFRAALTNATITQIQLANNITMTATTRWLGTTKIIEGNNYTLTFARNVSLQGATANQGLNLANIRIIADTANTITQSNTSSVSINNVTYANSQVTGRFLLLSGANSAVNIAGSNTFNGGAFVQGSSFSMTLHNYATLKVNNNGTARSVYSTGAGRISLDPGSTLDITQNNPSNTVKAVLLETSNSMINISENATLKITSAPDTNKTEEALGLRGSLNVANNGTIDILGRSVYSTINIGQTSTFQQGSNIRVQNNHTNGSAIGSYPGITQYTIFSSRGFQTWARGANLVGEPTFNYSNFTQGSFSLNGYRISQVTSNIISNDFQFNATFNSSTIAKIATGNFTVVSNIAQTTINELNNASTTVSGTGEPNATISILNGSNALITDRVGSDGVYNFTIAPQLAGSPLTARVEYHGLVSEASTTVLNSSQLVTPPTINSYFEGDEFATGTADLNGRDVGVYINGLIRRAVAINPDGTYSIYVGDLNLVAGDKFEIASINRTATGLITETGPKKEAIVLPLVITIDRYVLRQGFVNGSLSTGTNRRIFLAINGVFSRWGQVEANGDFTVYASDVITSTTQRVEIVVTDASQTEISRFPFTVNPN